jgi:hypothetical protein
VYEGCHTLSSSMCMLLSDQSPICMYVCLCMFFALTVTQPRAVASAVPQRQRRLQPRHHPSLPSLGGCAVSPRGSTWSHRHALCIPGFRVVAVDFQVPHVHLRRAYAPEDLPHARSAARVGRTVHRASRRIRLLWLPSNQSGETCVCTMCVCVCMSSECKCDLVYALLYTHS